jgi:glycosyltransferase involved in cell wall biosynthesis
LNTKAKILYLSYDGLTDPLGESQILPYLLGLSSEYDITIISFEKRTAFKRRREAILELLHDKIHWIPKSYTKNPPVLSTVYDLFVLQRTCRKLISKKRIDIVHCRSYLTSLIGLWLKHRNSIKFLFDMRGFWADERIEGGIWDIRNPFYKLIYKYFRKKEAEFIQQADHIIVLTDKANNILNSWGRIEDVMIIPCCVDTHLFDPDRLKEKDLNLRKQLGLSNGDFVMCYIGSTGTWYLLNEMFDFFNELSRHREKSKFLIVTTDSREHLLRVATLRNVNINHLIITQAERSEVPLYVSIADFTILFIKHSFSKQGSSPTKLAESLALGVPAIANTYVGDNDSLFQNSNLGFLIEKFNHNEYLRAAKKILEFKRNKDEIRKFAIQELSLEMAVSRYDKVYKKLLSKKD